jgi:hypothetical protein
MMRNDILTMKLYFIIFAMMFWYSLGGFCVEVEVSCCCVLLFILSSTNICAACKYSYCAACACKYSITDYHCICIQHIHPRKKKKTTNLPSIFSFVKSKNQEQLSYQNQESKPRATEGGGGGGGGGWRG